MDVPMELARIIITEHTDQQLVFLREKDGKRSFPILIGIAEAYAINRRLNNVPFPRPLTHDLLGNVIEAMGGKLEKIVINDIRKLDPLDFSQTFIATLHIHKDGEVFEVDSRPSDAIALGVGLDTPIFVAEHVLKTVTDSTPSAKDQINLLKRRVEMLREQISDLTAELEDEYFLAHTPESVVQDHRQQLREMQNEHDAIERVLRKLE